MQNCKITDNDKLYTMIPNRTKPLPTMMIKLQTQKCDDVCQITISKRMRTAEKKMKIDITSTENQKALFCIVLITQTELKRCSSSRMFCFVLKREL